MLPLILECLVNRGKLQPVDRQEANKIHISLDPEEFHCEIGQSGDRTFVSLYLRHKTLSTLLTKIN
jgi:hypothetical protein